MTFFIKLDCFLGQGGIFYCYIFLPSFLYHLFPESYGMIGKLETAGDS